MPEGEVAPGCVTYMGHPVNSNPFVQCYLPAGYKHSNKKSRCVSYTDSPGPGSRGSARTKAQAMECLKAWSHEWFNTLSPEEKEGIMQANEPARKRARKQ